MRCLATLFLLVVCDVFGKRKNAGSNKPKGLFDNGGDITSYDVNIEPEGRMSRRLEDFLDPLFNDVAYWIHFMNFSTDANDTKKECSSKNFEMDRKIIHLKGYLVESCPINLREEKYANLYEDCMNDISEFDYPPRVKIAFSLFCDEIHRWRIGPFNKWARGYENDEGKLMELATSVEILGGGRMPLGLSCMMEEIYLVQRCDRRNLFNFFSIISAYLKSMEQICQVCEGIGRCWMDYLSDDFMEVTTHMEKYYEQALKSSFTHCDSVNINTTIREHGPISPEEFPELAKKILKTLDYYGDDAAPKHLILTRYLTPDKDYYLHCPHGNCLSFRYKDLDLSIFYIRDPAAVKRRKAKRLNSTFFSKNKERIHEVFRENQNVRNLLEITGALIRANVSLTTNSAATLFLRRSATFGDCHLQFHYAKTQPGNYAVSVINEYFRNPWPQWPPWNVKACENLVTYVFP